MSDPRVLRVFLSSPGDVHTERDAADALLTALQRSPAWRGKFTFDVVRWDDPHTPVPMDAHLTPQQAVDAGMPKPSECDITVVVLWSRMGTPLEHEGRRYLSGTEYEYEDALSGSGRLLLYRRTEKPQIDLDDDAFDEKRQQYQSVKQFFERFTSEDGTLTGGYTAYERAEAFATRFRQDIETILRQIDQAERATPDPGAPAVADEEAPDQGAPAIPADYLEWLKKDCGSIDLLGLRLKQGQSIRIGSVYVPLTTSWRPPGAREPAPRDERDERASTTLLQVLDERSLYVSGAPGSGKSTFCRWVAWLLADGALPAQESESVDDGAEMVRERFPEALCRLAGRVSARRARV